MNFITLKSDIDGFTFGKIYLGTPNFQEGYVVSVTTMFVTDDLGDEREVECKDFYILDEVLLVLVMPIEGLDIMVGEVVRATGLEKGMYKIRNRFFVSSHFVILDWTNVNLGTYVCCKEDFIWRRIENSNKNNHPVSGSMWISVLCSCNFRSVSTVLFSIKYGEIQEKPLVICKESEGTDLEKGKVYELHKGALFDDKLVQLVGHGNKEYLSSRFFWEF